MNHTETHINMPEIGTLDMNTETLQNAPKMLTSNHDIHLQIGTLDMNHTETS